MPSINTISAVLIAVGVVVALVVEAGKKDWVMFAAWSCLGASSVVRLAQPTPWDGYLSMSLSFAFAILLSIRIWQRVKDPEWRAAWFK